MTRVFFATDIHGSEKCWLKFLKSSQFYKADVCILGGDITGKMVVPLIQQPNGNYVSSVFGKPTVIKKDKIQEHVKQVRNLGTYPYLTTQKEVDDLLANSEKQTELFMRLMRETVEKWIELADEQLKALKTKHFLCPGNDDRLEIDPTISRAKYLSNVEGMVINIDESHEMINSGWSNPTPWKTPRECSEADLRNKIDGMASQVKQMETCICQLHVPPHASGLDNAPELKDMRPNLSKTVPVGSIAVRDAIEKYQPMLGLHGHIHESRGASNLGRTLCVNPGSDYGDGLLRGYIIDIDGAKIARYFPAVG